METTAHRLTASVTPMPAPFIRARSLVVVASAAAILIVVVTLGQVARTPVPISSSIAAPPGSAAANSPRTPHRASYGP